MIAPTDNLVRALVEPDAATMRAATDGDGRTMFGHFAVFNQWTEINSVWEGHFFERLAPGAFARTMTERRDQVKVLYDHGNDPQLGNKPLGAITELREDKTGAYYEVRLLETSYNDDFVIPAASENLLGASFRFRVVGEEWHEPRASTKANPAKLPERTITDVDLYEFGPVTFPAYAGASAGVRSGTDEFFDRLAGDPLFLARFTDRVGLKIIEPLLDSIRTKPLPVTDDSGSESDPVVPDADAVESEPTVRSDDKQPPAPSSPPKTTYDERQRRLRQIEMSNKGIGKK